MRRSYSRCVNSYATRSSTATILVVDDEQSIRNLLCMTLRMSGFAVVEAADGATALGLAARAEPDLIVLDVRLPDIDGFSVAQTLRSGGNDVPVLFLTASGAPQDRIAGLKAGGDDFVVKPFSIEEVVLRIQAILRRASDTPTGTRLKYRDLEIDVDAHRVFRGGDEIWLSATEFSVLEYLVRNAEKVLTKNQILDSVWGRGEGHSERVVQTFISQLRRKIDDDRAPLIQTVRGVGYTVRADPPR
ncbi:response regulator transcription factor [Gordonia westfalica]|uniref:Response regulator transcription factor n=1 Tax=Gordonia westfalica TaxID=158898 RepID=A0ABU2GWV7_9ACTN|nr:response regulator transcription factor [Gordonia westfalica]MDS1115214.1 response regulator transcription factor [Gordonia westfalica]